MKAITPALPTAVVAALTALLGLAVPAPVVARTTDPVPTSVPGSPIRVVDQERDGRVRSYAVETASLERSSTTPVRVHVVLPDGYARHPHRRYPVLYALPGTSNRADVWLRNIHTVELTRGLPLIVVVPDGTYDGDGGGFYTDWVDQGTSRGVADWETFHTRELIDWVDDRFRTVAARRGRAVVGISQGGFGSMSYAARHPHLYGAAASFSGAVSIWQGLHCRVGATALIGGIMSGLNQVQPFAPFGDPLTHADTWRAHDPATQVRRLRHTRVDLYTSTGLPGRSDLSDPAVPGTVALEAVLHRSNLCFRDAADRAGIDYHWHGYRTGTHAWVYGDRSLRDYLPRLMRHFRTAGVGQRGNR